MFKRFQVADLFHGGDDKKEVKEWVPVEKPPESSRGIYKVRRANGDEIKAYYFDDAISSLATMNKIKPTYWWSKADKEPLYDVTHWGKYD